MKIIKKEIILVFRSNGYIFSVYLLLKISIPLERTETGYAGQENRFLCSHLLCFQGKFQCFRLLSSHLDKEKTKYWCQRQVPLMYSCQICWEQESSIFEILPLATLRGGLVSGKQQIGV